MTDAKAVSQTLRPSATVIALLNAATEQITTLTRERDAMRKDLLNLLAVAHGDGGHHTGSVGLQQSVADAERAFYALRQDAAHQLDLRYAANRELVALQRETDALRTVDNAMVERFLRAYAEYESKRQDTFTHRLGIRAALTAALSELEVQP